MSIPEISIWHIVSLLGGSFVFGCLGICILTYRVLQDQNKAVVLSKNKHSRKHQHIEIRWKKITYKKIIHTVIDAIKEAWTNTKIITSILFVGVALFGSIIFLLSLSLTNNYLVKFWDD